MAIEDKPVAICGCPDYDGGAVLSSVGRAIGLLGGLGKFVRPGDRVLLKPNLLQAAAPEKCVTTHPAVVRAVALLLRDHGCRVTIADSPGAGMLYSKANLRKVYAASGYDEVAEELGVGLNFGTGYKDVPNPSGRLVKRFLIIDPVLEADAVVVLSKAKTHMLTSMTGAAKNLFGVVPSLEKPALHSRFGRIDEFCEMIVDLNELVAPRLQVMDAVMVMEGDGPTTGEPRRIGAVLASPDCTALDSVAARLMSFDPHDIGTISAAVRRGKVRDDLSDVVVLGDRIGDFVVSDFKRPSTLRADGRQPRRRMSNALLPLVKAYSLKPYVLGDLCVGCGECARVCPSHAISMAKGKARIDRSGCNSCYCCHEMCTHKAISLRRSLGGRVMARAVERGKGSG